MKRHMKRRLNFTIVVVVFVLALFVTNKAQAAEVMTYPGAIKQTATMLDYTDSGYYALKGEGEDWYKFQTPSAPGYTTIYFKNTGMDNTAQIEVFNFLDESLFNDRYVYRSDNATTNKKFETGQTYYIKITGGNVGSTYVLDLNFIEDKVANDAANATEIDLNKEYIWSIDGDDDYDYAKFTANHSGKYKFLLKNTSVDHDMDFAIFKTNTDERLYNDWYVYKNDTAEVVLDLEAGQSYYFYMGACWYKTGNYTFSVNNQTVKSIALSETIVKIAKGKSTQLTAKVNPANAFNTTVTWASNNTDIAYVDANGNVTARKPGATLITCTANDGNGAISTCNVIVLPEKAYAYTRSSDSTSSSVKVQWNTVDSASGYTVYAYDTKTKKWNSVKTVKAGTNEAVIKSVYVSGKSKKLSSGTNYSFKVAAYVLIDNVKYYGEKSDTAKIATDPAKVTLKSVTNPATYTVKITWNKVSGASGYYIYQKSRYGDYYDYVTTITSGSKTSYTLTNYSTGNFTYKVSAYKIIDNVTYEGTASNAKTVNKKK